MYKKIILSLALCLTALITNAASNDLSESAAKTKAAALLEQKPERIQEEMKNAILVWNKAFNNKDIEALVGLYSSDALMSPGNGAVLVGHEEIAGLFKSFIDGGVNSHSLEIVKVGGDDNVIYQVAKWNAKGAEVDGIKPTFGGITTSVFKKNPEGKWVIKSHIWNIKQ
jgi:ketosteroid isomerase-like protein